MIPNRALTKHLFAATIVAFVFAIPLQEHDDNSNNSAPPPGITYVARSHYTIRNTVASESLPCRPNGLISMEDAEKAADGTLLSAQSLHEPRPDREFMVFEENESLLLARGEEAEPAKSRRESPTSRGAAEQLAVAVKHAEENAKPAPYSYASVAVTKAQGTVLVTTVTVWVEPPRDSHHRHVGATTAIIGSSSATTPTIIGPSASSASSATTPTIIARSASSASSATATTTIDYPVDSALDPDLRAHIYHRRADNHDWK
ncbi:hypothetical protein DL767_001264 [Monosporascus sp. MG133]|nr:hypothetical protein DL767_001264 [Monosporascus sp. MG133]